jgi:hypothetical protein
VPCSCDRDECCGLEEERQTAQALPQPQTLELLAKLGLLEPPPRMIDQIFELFRIGPEIVQPVASGFRVHELLVFETNPTLEQDTRFVVEAERRATSERGPFHCAIGEEVPAWQTRNICTRDGEDRRDHVDRLTTSTAYRAFNVRF